MRSSMRWILVGSSVAVLGVAGLFVVPLFLPEESTHVEEELPEQAPDTETLREGQWRGSGGHTVRGTLRIVSEPDGLYLWSIDYEQTAGPDVYLYLTPSSTPDSQAEIDAGRRILLDGGKEGRSTLEGTFRQKLPAGLRAEDLGGAGVWCDRFDVPFGYATLAPA